MCLLSEELSPRVKATSQATQDTYATALNAVAETNTWSVILKAKLRQLLEGMGLGVGAGWFLFLLFFIF